MLITAGVLAGFLALPPKLPGRDATPTIMRATPAARVLGETPGSVPVSLLIQQSGVEDDRLLGGSSPLARRVELHHAPLVRGVREMTPAADGLAIPGDTTTILEPERDHMMLIGLQENLVQGETFPLTLRFAHAGEVTVIVRVRRKVDAAGVTPIAPVTAGNLTISLASAPPAAAVATPRPSLRQARE